MPFSLYDCVWFTSLLIARTMCSVILVPFKACLLTSTTDWHSELAEQSQCVCLVCFQKYTCGELYVYKELLLCMWPYGNDMHGEVPILRGIGRRGSKHLRTAIALSLTCSMPLFATCAGIDRKLIAAMLILSYCTEHGKEKLCICGVH